MLDIEIQVLAHGDHYDAFHEQHLEDRLPIKVGVLPEVGDLLHWESGRSLESLVFWVARVRRRAMHIHEDGSTSWILYVDLCGDEGADDGSEA